MENTQCFLQKIRELISRKDGAINIQTSHPSWWMNRNVEYLYNHIIEKTNHIHENVSWKERIYWFFNELEELPKCSVCGDSVKFFYNNKTGYADTCSRKCSGLSPKRAEKIKNSYDNRTAEEKLVHTEKIKLGCMKKYGVDNISKTQHFHNTYKKRMNDKYGVDNYFEMTDKVRESVRNKYGCDSVQQVHEIKQKTLRAVKKKYGEMIGACPAAQTKKTCLERYGKEHFFASDAGRMNNDTLRENYGWSDEDLQKLKDSRNSMSFDWAVRQTSSIEEAMILHKKRITDCIVPLGKASNESLGIFIPLYKFLRKNKIDRKYIHFGIGGSCEYFLYDEENKCVYSYDFCVKTPDRKFIIEYNGTAFHPKSENDGLWKHPFDDTITSPTVYAKDQRKLQIARDSGFEVLVLWSDINLENNKQLSMSFSIKNNYE